MRGFKDCLVCFVCFVGIFASVWSIPVTADKSFPDTLERVKPSVVGVATYLPSRTPPTVLVGTGFVVGDGRQIATNYHVIDKDLDAEKRERLVVLVGTGRRARGLHATVGAVDSDRDIALLRINEKLTPLPIATAEVREGEIYAFTGFPIGSVLGLYPVTHRGMISSITPVAIPARSSRNLDPVKLRRLRDPMLIYQLDATAYPGNSGSPLYHMQTGEVVGVLNQVYVKRTKEDVLKDPSGISYAIPSRYLSDLLSESE